MPMLNLMIVRSPISRSRVARASLAASLRCLAGLVGLFVAAALAAAPAVAQDRFTLGSPSLTVAEVQGRPPMVERLRSQGYEIWRYGESWVRISAETDQVIGWWNADGRLKVEM
ncbi:MAG: hypothetical protein P3B98_12030, partial [Gemmatimonadota bacterium]|nr:hypothetical protein [Gemmatimonadota bacterium]